MRKRRPQASTAPGPQLSRILMPSGYPLAREASLGAHPRCKDKSSTRATPHTTGKVSLQIFDNPRLHLRQPRVYLVLLQVVP